MFRFKSYVELLLLMSIFPSAMPQLRNLSPLRGRLNSDLPDALRTVAAPSAITFRDGAFPQPPQQFGQAPPQLLAQLGLKFKNFINSIIAPNSAIIDASDIRASLKEASAIIDASDIRAALEEVFAQNSSGSAGGSGSFHNMEGASLSLWTFRKPQPASEMESNCIGRPLEHASKILLDLAMSNGLTRAEALMLLPTIDLDEKICGKLQKRSNCIISPPLGTECDPNSPYRSLDGSCNNFDNPKWGVSMRRFNRYLWPAYEDGISKMRGEDRNIPLPSARTVSAGLQDATMKSSSKEYTMMVMQWGQFLDHDITHTAEAPEAPSNDNDTTPDPIRCCEFGKGPFSSNEDCRPIDVTNDPIFSREGRTCMHFVRSIVASKGCSTGSLGPREQQNQVTSYLDASNVYGSDDEEAEGLRTHIGGLLNNTKPPTDRHGGTFLPRRPCGADRINYQCFEAGDTRVSEQPGLTSMHTLWVRVHNNIANDLTSINPSWDDQIIYQETRRIVSALHQQITYREFLPIVLGPDYMRDFQLNLRDQGYDTSYNASVDATVANVIATAAFRFGHTLVNEIFKGLGRNVTLRGNFQGTSVLENPSTGPAALLHGLTRCPTQGSDAFVTPTLVNRLFSNSIEPVGLDLISLNIQRGRDHGLPPYHQWRRSCELSKITSFDDLYSIMDPKIAALFEKSYQSVEDIDLFPAALAENIVVGGLLGPTFSCLLAQQFQALKVGDRFWYENENQPKPFTTEQLSALRQQSLASVMCHYLPLKILQPMAFQSDLLQGNQLQDCSTFPKLDLQFWSPTPIPYSTPKPYGRYAKRPMFPCITPGTPTSHLFWFFPRCTPDLFI